VLSDDPGNKTGNGMTPVDIEVTDEHHIFLRAERSGPGAGRTYLVTVQCSDEAGNVTEEQTTVFVPHDKSIPKSNGSKDQVGTSKKSAVINQETLNEPFRVDVWPNPTDHNFTLEVQSSSDEKIVVSVTDILGRLVSDLQVSGMKPASFGEDLKPGIYFITVRQGNYLKNIKVTKQ
jgi:hypothetical protein